MKPLIIIPAYNEEEGLKRLLPELAEYAPLFDILLIDDGSTDETVSVATHHKIQVIQIVKGGIGSAMQTGFLYALKHGHPIAIQMDADGQHDPIFLQNLILPIIEKKADFVIGSRYMAHPGKQAYKTPFFRRAGMIYSSLLLYFFSGIHITDTTSGFRALNHKTLKLFETQYPPAYPEAGVIFRLILAGFKIVEVPVDMRERKHGKSMYSSIKTILYPFHILIGLIRIGMKS